MVLGSNVVLQAEVYVDSGHPVTLPVIVTNEGVLKSFLEYLLKHRSKSAKWQQASVKAMRRFLDYCDANYGNFFNPAEMFTEFSNSLFTGTFDQYGNDPSGLGWTSLSAEYANKTIMYITMYSDWLAEKNDRENLKLNPFRKATAYEAKLNWAAHVHRNENAFLGHLFNSEQARVDSHSSRNVSYRQKPKSDNCEEVNTFPEGRIFDLLFKGFVVPGKEADENFSKKFHLRDILITMLMHFGGVRTSEPFHLWIDDVMPDPISPDSALVKIYHPIEGRPPTRYKPQGTNLRKNALMQYFNLIPRNEYPDSKKIHAGWKNPLLDDGSDKYLIIEWFPANAGVLFMNLWRLYLQQRVSPKEDKMHPYAFTNQYGDPYSIDAFRKKHIKAVEVIGLVSDKYYGTTNHGHRHRYGKSLRQAGVAPHIRKKAMHHKSMQSTEIYGAPDHKEVREAFKDAENEAKHNNFTQSNTNTILTLIDSIKQEL